MTTPATTPTGWFLASTPTIDNGEPYTAARWYWPDSTDVEIYDHGTRQWERNDSFRSINDDPKWSRVTEGEVAAWIAGLAG